jgi:hypothetical protein
MPPPNLSLRLIPTRTGNYAEKKPDFVGRVVPAGAQTAREMGRKELQGNPGGPGAVAESPFLKPLDNEHATRLRVAFFLAGETRTFQ